MIKVGILNLGCKVNQFEGESIGHLLELEGFRVVRPEEADLVIINACVVTHRAEADARKALHRFKRLGKRVLVAGCWPQLSPDTPLSQGADGVLGNQEKARIGEIVRRFLSGERIKEVGPLECSHYPKMLFPLPRERTRAFLKIQDGCDSNCTYCVVPRVRGRPRSLDPEAIFCAMELYSSAGVKEVVLCGIHLGKWGQDLGAGMDLLWLLQELEQKETPPRIRLSSIEPHEVSDGLIELLRTSEKLCPHLHLPIQSASSRILEMMGRPYRSGDLWRLIERLKEGVPGIALGADLIAGFPGEGEEEFWETVRFVQSQPFSYLHVFPFSRRPGTPASSFPGQVRDSEKVRRVRILRELGQRKRIDFYSGFIGRKLMVLSEGQKDGEFRGLSRNYIRCAFNEPVPAGEEFEAMGIGLKGERLLIVPSRAPTTRSTSNTA